MATIRAHFIRHGQSTANVGLPCSDHTLIELTESGRGQAEALASRWSASPHLIAISAYLRARQTAEPTLRRFPHAPVETWPIQEFTYLEPSRWNGTSTSQRVTAVESYWTNGEPCYQDGPCAESFSALLRRAEAVIQRLTSAFLEGDVFLFSHQQFIQAVQLTLAAPQSTDAEKMAHFLEFGRRNPIGNAGVVTLTLG